MGNKTSNIINCSKIRIVDNAIIIVKTNPERNLLNIGSINQLIETIQNNPCNMHSETNQTTYR